MSSAGGPLVPREESCDFEWGMALLAARRVSPFMPRRVLAAFAGGLLGGTEGGNSRTCCPRPRFFSAAALLIDVSGFTRLSEEARARAGSDGAETFAAALSAFFAAITQITANFAGDVNCFAGDAMLVVFEPLSGGHPALLAAVNRAFACANAVHQRLDGFRHEPEDPPLRIHSAIAVGTPLASARTLSLFGTPRLAHLVWYDIDIPPPPPPRKSTPPHFRRRPIFLTLNATLGHLSCPAGCP